MNEFDERTRFNQGYHSAAQGVIAGWATPDRGFGFIGNFKTPEEVRNNHPDPIFSKGWYAGFYDAKNGTYQGNIEESEKEAWDLYIKIHSTSSKLQIDNPRCNNCRHWKRYNPTPHPAFRNRPITTGNCSFHCQGGIAGYCIGEDDVCEHWNEELLPNKGNNNG